MSNFGDTIEYEMLHAAVRAARMRTVINHYCEMPLQPPCLNHVMHRLARYRQLIAAAHVVPESASESDASSNPSMPDLGWGDANAANANTNDANTNDDIDSGISTATQNADDVESIHSCVSFSTCSEVVVHTADNEHIVNAPTL